MLDQARRRLVETGGRTSQDLGAGRIVGQVLIYLYLQERECSLDLISDDLELSKASVSIAARQLEQLGLVRKVWRSGDRKNYYRSTEDIATALQQGVLALVQQKVQVFGRELDEALLIIEDEMTDNGDADKRFLHSRVSRAKKLQSRLALLLNNPVVNFFSGTKAKD